MAPINEAFGRRMGAGCAGSVCDRSGVAGAAGGRGGVKHGIRCEAGRLRRAGRRWPGIRHRARIDVMRRFRHQADAFATGAGKTAARLTSFRFIHQINRQTHMPKISGSSSKSHQVTEAAEDTERRPNHKTKNLSIVSLTAPKSNEELRSRLRGRRQSPPKRSSRPPRSWQRWVTIRSRTDTDPIPAAHPRLENQVPGDRPQKDRGIPNTGSPTEDRIRFVEMGTT
ncbi:hypothetical protein V4890_19975 [Ralstonia solanacearum species complex bacterium KE056]|uniref:hypothetical protein n=1 Tax=Ralstonia solanacearum species complex bacterium KE056 TaxID=3119585 RepID=UPI002FC34FA4